MNGDNQALGAALGTDMQPAPFKEPDYAKLRTLPQVFSEEQRIGKLQAQAAGEMKQAELTQQANLAGEQAKAATQVADKARTYIDDMHKKEAEFPYPEFHPTQDNAQSLAGLFSIVSTLGVMLGNTGKQSGLNAMSAMSGMMNGWQQGRANLFKQEKETFDKEFNRIKVLRDDLRKDVEDYMKLLPYDKEAAMYKAAEISAKTGSESIINAYVKNGQAQNALKLLDSAGKMIQHEEDKRMQRELAQIKASGGAALPKDKDTRNSYEARYQTVKNIEDIESLLTNPKYSRLITPATQFTPSVLANLQKNFPELSQKLARIQAIEFQIGGKALTANEQKILEPLYGWRGLTVNALKDRLAGVKEDFARRNQMEETFYPGLKNVASSWDQIYGGSSSPKLPSMPAPEKQEYSIGDIITKAGKKLRVKAAIKDEQGNIVDYDVEEVK